MDTPVDILGDMISQLRVRTNGKSGSVTAMFIIDANGKETLDWTMRVGNTTVSSQDGRKVLQSFCSIMPETKPPF